MKQVVCSVDRGSAPPPGGPQDSRPLPNGRKTLGTPSPCSLPARRLPSVLFALSTDSGEAPVPTRGRETNGRVKPTGASHYRRILSWAFSVRSFAAFQELPDAAIRLPPEAELKRV